MNEGQHGQIAVEDRGAKGQYTPLGVKLGYLTEAYVSKRPLLRHMSS